MKYPIYFRVLAVSDLESAQDYYTKIAPSLGKKFQDRVEKVFQTLESMPETYAKVHKSLRAAKVKKFPYVVYYKIQPEQIEVFAVVHGMTNPANWQERDN